MNRLVKLALFASLMLMPTCAEEIAEPDNPFVAITEALEKYASHLQKSGDETRAKKIEEYADKFRKSGSSQEESFFLGFDPGSVLNEYATELRKDGVQAKATEVEALAEWWNCRNFEAYWQDYGKARDYTGDRLRYLILQNLSEDCHALLLAEAWRFDRLLSWAAVSQAREGRFEVTAEDLSISVNVPDGMELDETMAHRGFISFGDSFTPNHTKAATVEINPLGLVKIGWYGDVYSEMDAEQKLKRLLEEVDRRIYSDTQQIRFKLRSYEQVGGTLAFHAAQRLICQQRAVVQENRGVPGQVGTLFLFHLRLYTCVEPRSNVPIELVWSERYPAESRQLSASFADDAAAFFGSARIESLRW